jgi:hypothetical protein
VHTLFELLARQHAVVTTAQARSAGVSTRVQRRLIADGVLLAPAPGLLAAAGCAPTFESRAMAATLLPGVAAVSHGAAARLHGLDAFGDHDVVDVLAGKGAGPPPVHGVIVRFTRGPIGDHTTEVAGVPVLTLAATLVLLAPAVGVVRTRAALDEAIDGGLDVDELHAVADAWRQRGRAGPPALLALLRQRTRRREVRPAPPSPGCR